MTTKEKILKATLSLASERGLGNVSMSQIAKRVGIQKPSLYNHFTSKEEIILGLYSYLRLQARSKIEQSNLDYGEFVKGKTPADILKQTVFSYISMNQEHDMTAFYKFIMSERSLKKEAAQIMTAETERMILSTKQLFYAMQVQHIMEFRNPDMAAFSFAMAIHSIMDYMHDQALAEAPETAKGLLTAYIENFCELNW